MGSDWRSLTLTNCAWWPVFAEQERPPALITGALVRSWAPPPREAVTTLGGENPLKIMLGALAQQDPAEFAQQLEDAETDADGFRAILGQLTVPSGGQRIVAPEDWVSLREDWACWVVAATARLKVKPSESEAETLAGLRRSLTDIDSEVRRLRREGLILSKLSPWLQSRLRDTENKNPTPPERKVPWWIKPALAPSV